MERTHAGGKCFYLMKIHVQFLETSFSIERVLIIYNGGLDIFTWGLSRSGKESYNILVCLRISNFAVVRHWLSFPFGRRHTAKAACGCTRRGWEGSRTHKSHDKVPLHLQVYSSLRSRREKSPFPGGEERTFFFFFFCTHQRFKLCARPLTLITPHLCIHLHRILSSEERCASISEHFSPFHVYIQCSTARAELVRKIKPKKKNKKKTTCWMSFSMWFSAF